MLFENIINAKKLHKKQLFKFNPILIFKIHIICKLIVIKVIKNIKLTNQTVYNYNLTHSGTYPINDL